MLLVPGSVQPFKAPQKALRSLDADVVGLLVATAADLALLIDKKGVITDLAFSNENLAHEGAAGWTGKRWIDTVTVESRPKIDEMLKESASSTPSRPRHVNHLSQAGQSVAVRYSVVPLGHEGRVVAVGRDMKAITVLQQRLLQAQQDMEREYARLRAIEGRHRFLFQMTTEPIVVVDAATMKLVESNSAAARLFGRSDKRMNGQTFRQLLPSEAAQAVETLLATVRTVGRADEITVKAGSPESDHAVQASLFRQDGTTHFLVRLSVHGGTSGAAAGRPEASNLHRILAAAPDGFVVTGSDWRILSANAAFLDLVNLPSEEQARGEPLEKYIGRAGVDFNVLTSNLKEHSSVKRFWTTVSGEFGVGTDVEISAVNVPNGDPPCAGFVFHAAAPRPAPGANVGTPRSIEQMKELIGRMPLKDVVRETTDAIERMCIEAALELTGDNRASAAEMLGLSRQSLYGKLRRFGMGGLGSGDE